MPVKKIDPTRPLYAVVGAGDLAVGLARQYTADVQARFARLELEPRALREHARTAVGARIDELNEDAKEARSAVETRAKQARTQLETYLNGTVSEVTETYGDLAARGRTLLARIRRQQSTQEAKASARTTVVKAKTANTQTAKAAKRSTKATATSAKKTAAATTEAAVDSAEKIGD